MGDGEDEEEVPGGGPGLIGGFWDFFLKGLTALEMDTRKLWPTVRCESYARKGFRQKIRLF